ncbi:MAG: hypothetical protein HIU89_05090 [Proteobacteria bacterium]|nr:hypothetical protein [Pseudomonadota bacterium]
MSAERFHWDNPLRLDAPLSPVGRAIQESAAFGARERAPRVLNAFRHEITDPGLLRDIEP